MRVELKGIKFNYDPDDLSKTGALNLRRNETQIVRIPEWQPDMASSYDASPAAYAICSLPAQITIQACFNCESNLANPIMVRAIPEFTDHILGNVEPVEIPANGSSGFKTLNLPDARLACAGVGIHDIGWRWQFSKEFNIWTDFQTTRHRIYTVLARPSEPWEPKSPASSNIHQPWTDVLDVACCWASGAHCDLDEAAKLISKEFFKLGVDLLSYKEGASYAFSEFNCTQFLTLLSRGIGGNQTVNCDDCATIVSTFANILGCQLFQSSMGGTFNTHPVILIGEENFACTGFHYHAVAWKGQCEVNDDVFDGCLQIDMDLKQPWIPVQPANIPFGNEKAGYRYSVVRDSPNCRPIPNHSDYGRRRRRIGLTYLGDVGISNLEAQSELARIYDFESWPKAEETVDSNNSLVDIVREHFVAGWTFHSGKHFQDERFRNVVQILLRRSDFSQGELLDVNLYDCHDSSDPNRNLLEILGRFERFTLKRRNELQIGHIGFANEAGTTVAFRRARFLAVVRSAGKRELHVVEIARIVDIFLTQHVNPQLTTKHKGEEAMAHKLKGLKRIFKFDFTGSDPVLKPAGYLDLTKMEDNGNLPEGTHVDDVGASHPIKGRAYVYKGEMYLTFAHQERGTFLGRLILDQAGNKLIVTGSLTTTDPTIFLEQSEGQSEEIKQQQEQVLVITKP